MIVYAFRCAVCGLAMDEARTFGDTAPPFHCGQPARRVYQVSRPISRPKGYHLHPGDKGYWDFGEFNDPNTPPERGSIEPFSAYYEAERDIARAADYDGDESA